MDVGQRRVIEFRDLIVAAADREGLDPALVAGLIYCESAGDAYALRIERGFWRRYYQGIKRVFQGNNPKRLAKWMRYPDLVAASYGLCQIMLPVAVENGFDAEFPTRLLDPKVNIDLGASILARHIARRGGDRLAGLLRYNGGGDPDYPRRVTTAADKFLELFGERLGK
jgi:soluble lytic murein transglycosylase-like protein